MATMSSPLTSLQDINVGPIRPLRSPPLIPYAVAISNRPLPAYFDAAIEQERGARLAHGHCASPGTRQHC
jgi:hypothetical protein